MLSFRCLHAESTGGIKPPRVSYANTLSGGNLLPRADFEFFQCPRQDQVRGYQRSRKIDFFIKFIPVKTKLTYMIEDSDIGTTKNKLVNNLGASIFRVPRLSWMSRVPAATLSMIGPFGGGLCSASSVSDKVRVVSENNDFEQHIFESSAGGSFTEQKDTEIVQGEVKRGTKVICYLKEDESVFSSAKHFSVEGQLSSSFGCSCHVALPSTCSRPRRSSTSSCTSAGSS